MPFCRSLRRHPDYAPRAVAGLQRLRAQLAREVPARTLTQTLLLATWNMKNTALRDFHSSGRKQGQPRTDAEKQAYYTKDWRTWQMSDHYPLWVELCIDFSDRYLKRVQTELEAR